SPGAEHRISTRPPPEPHAAHTGPPLTDSRERHRREHTMTTDPTSATRNRTGPRMSRGARLPPEVTDDVRLARARERFLAAEPIEPGQVRETILASWRRSREWHVAADRIDLSYVRDPDLDTPLPRPPLPVLKTWHESLRGEPVSVILTDAH